MAKSRGMSRYQYLAGAALLLTLAVGLLGAPKAWAQSRGETPFAVADWKQAVQDRLQVETQWPGTGNLFAGREPGDRSALADALSTDKSEGLAAAWVAMAMGLAQSPKGNAHLADSYFERALNLGKGRPGFLFEGTLVLMRARQTQRAKIWQAHLERELLSLGYVRSPAFAKIVLIDARHELKRGQKMMALQRIDFAEKLDPLSPWNHAARMEAAVRKRMPWNWDMGVIWTSGMGIANLMRYYDNGLPLLYNFLHWGRLTLQGIGLFLLIALMLRYYTRVTHLLAERLPRIVDLPWRYLAIGVVALSFYVAGVGILYLAAPLVLVLWNAARPSERGLFRGIFAGLLFMPILLTCEHAVLRHLDPKEGLHYYHAAFESGFDPDLVRRIELFDPKAAEDQFYKTLALSLQYRKLGNTVKAEATLKQAKALTVRHAFLHLHEGNLAMMVRDYAAAEKHYLTAMQVAPTWVETWFNASQAALFQNRSDAHKQRLEKAADADPGYLTLYLKQNDEAFTEAPALRRAMDPMPRFEMSLWPAVEQFTSLKFLTDEMASGLLTVPSWALLALTLVCMVAVAFRQQRSPFLTGKSTFNCKICDKVMCRHCRKGVHCESCFKSVAGVADLRLREELVQRLRLRTQHTQQTVYRILNTAIPGLGDIFVGAGGMPLLWLTLSISSWALLAQVSRPLIDYPVQVMGLFAYMPWVPLVIVYALYNAFTYLPGGLRLVVGSQREIEL
jgi:tetratricopeptide (TPR) repeat protein